MAISASVHQAVLGLHRPGGGQAARAQGVNALVGEGNLLDRAVRELDDHQARAGRAAGVDGSLQGEARQRSPPGLDGELHRCVSGNGLAVSRSKRHHGAVGREEAVEGHVARDHGTRAEGRAHLGAVLGQVRGRLGARALAGMTQGGGKRLDVGQRSRAVARQVEARLGSGAGARRLVGHGAGQKRRVARTHLAVAVEVAIGRQAHARLVGVKPAHQAVCQAQGSAVAIGQGHLLREGAVALTAHDERVRAGRHGVQARVERAGRGDAIGRRAIAVSASRPGRFLGEGSHDGSLGGLRPEGDRPRHDGAVLSIQLCSQVGRQCGPRNERRELHVDDGTLERARSLGVIGTLVGRRGIRRRVGGGGQLVFSASSGKIIVVRF